MGLTLYKKSNMQNVDPSPSKLRQVRSNVMLPSCHHAKNHARQVSVLMVSGSSGWSRVADRYDGRDQHPSHPSLWNKEMCSGLGSDLNKYTI